jgi:hypothetical protein
LFQNIFACARAALEQTSVQTVFEIIAAPALFRNTALKRNQTFPAVEPAGSFKHLEPRGADGPSRRGNVLVRNPLLPL